MPAECSIPEHGVLSKILFWPSMMYVVVANVVEVRNLQAESGVVEGGQYSAEEDEDSDCGNVGRNNEYNEEMQIFADEELERMDVDGVVVSSGRRNLAMVVLVHVLVNRTEVEQPVKGGVEEVVDDEKSNEAA